ncbi:hypothetical protein ENBRE01_1733 [Enteropsectra breve]|nr:hypothetical protein ENBRE01_1733 [Enteropsectra breve]
MFKIDTEFGVCEPRALSISEKYEKIRVNQERYKKELIKGKKQGKREKGIGSKVWVYNFKRKGPFDANWIQGYTVIGWVGEDAYKLEKDNRKYTANKKHVKLHLTN